MDNEFWNNIYVDIHNFITFNDQFGHVAGDKVIESLESKFEHMEVFDLKRISGNKWNFRTKWHPSQDVNSELRNMMEWAKSRLHITLNVVLTSELDREKDALYQLKVARESGGDLILVLPYSET